MNEKQTPSDSAVDGKTQEELEEGYRAFRASLRKEYKTIKQRDYDFRDEHREIGYHVHMHSK